MITPFLLKVAMELSRVPEIEITCITDNTVIGKVTFSNVSKLCRICLNHDSFIVFNGLHGKTRLFFKVQPNLPF